MPGTQQRGAVPRISPRQRVLAVLLSAGCAALAACGGGERENVLVPDGSPSFTLMDFRSPLPLDPVPAGWRHRTFLRHPPMEISFVTKEGRPAIRLATSDSASMLFRHVDVALDVYPELSWDWYIEQSIESPLDESTVAGDDQPARLYLEFESASGESHAMELIWGRQLRAGAWKILTFYRLFRFPHYVVNGGDEKLRRWLHERVDMGSLYRERFGDPKGAHLLEIALFCDSDDTDTESVAYFSDIRVAQSS